MRRSVLAAAWLVLASGVAGCINADFNQASLVPPPAAPPIPAFENAADLAVSDPSVAMLRSPSPEPGHGEEDHWVARHVLDVAAGVRLIPRLRLRAFFREAFHQDAVRITDTGELNPGVNAHAGGFGVSVRLLGFDGAPVAFDGTFALLGAGIPTFVPPQCVMTTFGGTECTDRSPRVSRDRIPIFSLHWVLRVFVTERFDVTILSGIQTQPTQGAVFGDEDPGELHLGGPNLLLGAGFALRAADWLDIEAQLHGVPVGTPFDYGPTLSVTARVRYGEADEGREPRGPLVEQ